MKKSFVLAAAVAVIALATSCKKDYTCACEYKVGDETYTTEAEYKGVKKKDAEEACDAANAALSIYDSGKCDLK
jgi:hypothetical protein